MEESVQIKLEGKGSAKRQAEGLGGEVEMARGPPESSVHWGRGSGEQHLCRVSQSR